MTLEDTDFDIRKIPEINRKIERQDENSSTAKVYWDKQNFKRGHLAIVKPLIEKVNEIKNVKGFKNDSQALEYLLDLEDGIKKHNLIKETKSCEKCGTPINVKLDSYKGITHRHIDVKSNCIGCITTKYSVANEEQKDNKIGVNCPTCKTKEFQHELKTVDGIHFDCGNEKCKKKFELKEIVTKQEQKEEKRKMTDEEIRLIKLKAPSVF